MSKRHIRDTFFIVAKGIIRGIVERLATPDECEHAFRFSEIVSGTSPSPSDALLEALAELMTAQGPDGNSHIPAGFTYLGQFVDHDLTRDRTEVSFGTPVLEPELLIQARSPALDLDSVYGMGPSVEPIFYEPDGIHIKTGTAQKSAAGRGLENVFADNPQPGFDLPRWGAAAAKPEEARMPMIPDPRNDENLAVGQTHLAFIRFHNKVCDRLSAAGTADDQLFDCARELVVKHYQWMLLTDFLPRIIDNGVLHDVFTSGRKIFEVGADGFPTMPLEFAVAAYRLGHSMIRDKYNWNVVFGTNGTIGDLGTLDNLFRFSGTSGNLSPGTDLDNPLDGTFENLPTNWVADWTRLYDFVADGSPELEPESDLNFTRPLDIRLTDPLKNLPLGSFGARGTEVPPMQLNLAFRNLARGKLVGLASGQEVAGHIASIIPGTPILTREQILGEDLDALSDEQKNELASSTPLWFYILREASLNTAGVPGAGRLGAVGSRIVAEVFHRAIEGSRISILNERGFVPSLGKIPGVFRMTDLLKVAYDGSKGELRPLSLNALRSAP